MDKINNYIIIFEKNNIKIINIAKIYLNVIYY